MSFLRQRHSANRTAADGMTQSRGRNLLRSRLMHSEEIVDPKFGAILNSLPAKEPRSRLEPYSELITKMRKRGHSYREITQVAAPRIVPTELPLPGQASPRRGLAIGP